MRTAYLLAGISYGDEAKGSITDFICLTRDASLVVRYNGASQAAHNVIGPNGHHTFSQFGSGTFVPGCRTHLSKFMLINPINMMNEEAHLRGLGVTDAFDRLSISSECLVITPFQRAVNRLEQKFRGVNTSCGAGVGQTRIDHHVQRNKVLFAGDFARGEQYVKDKLWSIQRFSFDNSYRFLVKPECRDSEEADLLSDLGAVDWYWKEYAAWPGRNCIVKEAPGAFRAIVESCGDGNIVFEGAQGVLLDEAYGEPGYNTWTNTTFDNAVYLLAKAGWDADIQRIGVIRSYMTRHGDGPFVEDPALDCLPEPHNHSYGFQGKFRRGQLDLDKIKHAIRICGGIDGLAVNHLDQLPAPNIFSVGKVLIEGFGPTAGDKVWKS